MRPFDDLPLLPPPADVETKAVLRQASSASRTLAELKGAGGLIPDQAKELIELIFRQPYCRISFLVEAGIAERKTASVCLQELERIGILRSEKRGREIVYRQPALLEVLTS